MLKIMLKLCGRCLIKKKPDDFVISTNKQYTIKKFVNIVCEKLKIKIKWKGKGIKEKAYDQNNNCIIQIDKRYIRPLEVHNLKGNFSKARKILKWKPKRNLSQLVEEMLKYELESNDQ